MTACTVALEQMRNDFRVNLAVALEILRAVVLPGRSGPFSFNPLGSKKTFIDFYFSRKRRLGFIKFGDAFPNYMKITID